MSRLRKRRSVFYMTRVTVAGIALGAVLVLIWMACRKLSEPMPGAKAVDNGVIRYQAAKILNNL